MSVFPEHTQGNFGPLVCATIGDAYAGERHAILWVEASGRFEAVQAFDAERDAPIRHLLSVTHDTVDADFDKARLAVTFLDKNGQTTADFQCDSAEKEQHALGLLCEIDPKFDYFEALKESLLDEHFMGLSMEPRPMHIHRLIAAKTAELVMRQHITRNTPLPDQGG